MNIKWWKAAGGAILLGTLGTLLYFSAAGFLNLLVVPLMKGLEPEQQHQLITPVLILLSFVAALIAGLFSAFLFEMVTAWRPLLMGVLFALPSIGTILYVAGAAGMPVEMQLVYGLESLAMLLAFVAMAFLGRFVARRFFSTEHSA